jgi:YD repeat-containing protein
VTTLAYDTRNLLESVTNPDGQTVTYRYNALRQRTGDGDRAARDVFLQDASHSSPLAGGCQGHLIRALYDVPSNVLQVGPRQRAGAAWVWSASGLHMTDHDLPSVHVESQETCRQVFRRALYLSRQDPPVIRALARGWRSLIHEIVIASPTPGHSWQLPLRAQGSTGWAAGCSVTTAGSLPIGILERPLESLGPAELACFSFLAHRGFNPQPSAQTKRALGGLSNCDGS